MTSSSLVSLREMLLTYARAFAMTCADLEMTRWGIAATMVGDVITLPTDAPLAKQLRGNLDQLRTVVVKIPTLDRLLPHITRLEADIGKSAPILRIIQAVEHLQNTLFDELSRHVYYHVEERLVPYYQNDLPFGEQVFQNFPSATIDITSAGRCLALGQGTAAVFHLMLVLELGLSALGKALGIPYAPSWESYLRQINAKMAEKHAKKSAAWKRDESFFRDVAGDLQLVKIAWRNPTMHIVRGRAYEVADAERVYEATRTLMQRLAQKLKEPTRRQVVSVGPVATQEELS